VVRISPSAALLVSRMAVRAARRFSSAVRSGVAATQQVQRGSGLDGDRRHAVRHGVVQVAGYPEALLRHPAAGVGSVFLPGQAEPVRSFGGQRTPAADRVAEPDRQPEHHDGREEIHRQRDESLTCAHLNHENAYCHVDGRDDDGRPQVAGQSRVVERQRQQRRRGDVAAVQCVRDEEQHRAGDEHAQRPSPPEQDRNRHDHAEQVGERVERCGARAATHHDIEFDDGGYRRCRGHVEPADAERVAQAPQRRTWHRGGARCSHAVKVRDPARAGNGPEPARVQRRGSGAAPAARGTVSGLAEVWRGAPGRPHPQVNEKMVASSRKPPARSGQSG
jgi:hypothetical protein